MEMMARWPRCSYLYSRDLARWYRQGPHSSKEASSRKRAHALRHDIPRRAGPRGEIELFIVGLTWVCLQLDCCCGSQKSYSYNRSFPSRARFLLIVKH